VPRSQVRITAFIFDANIQELETLGVNWNSAVKGNNVDDEGVAQQLIRNTGVVGPTPAAGALNGAATFMSLTNNFDVTAVVNALRTSSSSRLLADPTVVVSDHESARIATVTEIPYQQLTQSAMGGSIGTTAFREAGVTLEVTPRIANDGTVSLMVTPTFSILTGFTEGTNQPIIARREAQTVVRVANNQTLVIGGLRQRGKVRDRNAVPGLGDIPLVGHLFRYRKDEVRESELIVFLTPTIVPYDAFGTMRENAALDAIKCELDKVRQEGCYRCNEPSDPTIYTNPELGGVPVTIPPEAGTALPDSPRSEDDSTKPAEEVPARESPDGERETRAGFHRRAATRGLSAPRATRDASESTRRGETSDPPSAILHAAKPYTAPIHTARTRQAAADPNGMWNNRATAPPASSTTPPPSQTRPPTAPVRSVPVPSSRKPAPSTPSKASDPLTSSRTSGRIVIPESAQADPVANPRNAPAHSAPPATSARPAPSEPELKSFFRL